MDLSVSRETRRPSSLRTISRAPSIPAGAVSFLNHPSLSGSLQKLEPDKGRRWSGRPWVGEQVPATQTAGQTGKPSGIESTGGARERIQARRIQVCHVFGAELIAWPWSMHSAVGSEGTLLNMARWPIRPMRFRRNSILAIVM